MGGWPAGGIETKTKSVQIQLNLPVGTKLGKINKLVVVVNQTNPQSSTTNSNFESLQ